VSIVVGAVDRSTADVEVAVGAGQLERFAVES
jgi:hypothetical protein